MSHTPRYILIFFLTVSAFVQSPAQMRSSEDVQQIAVSRLDALNNDPSGIAEEITLSARSKRLIRDLQAEETTGEAFHVFRNKKNDSFVIVSGDVRMKPILGECRSSNLSADSIPCGLASLLAHYADQYADLQTVGADTLQPEGVSDLFYAEVPPLISTQWGQGSPYNDYCPPKCPSGCVATAMSQIMNFYQYPVSGIGSNSYTSYSRKYNISYDFASARFEWSLMKDKYPSSGYIGAEEYPADDPHRDAVANIMKACGVSVEMDYSPGGSGASDADIPYSIINFFGYNSTATCYYRPYFNNEQWYERLHEELDAGRPVLYCGKDTYRSNSHAFIIDGFRQSDGKFHVNWGWDGSFDGYYELDALSPSVYRFSSDQSMIVRFCPDEEGEHEDVFYAESFSADNKIEAGQNISCTLKGVTNLSNSSSFAVITAVFNGVIGIGLYDKDFTFVRSLAEEEFSSIHAAAYFGEIKMPFLAPNEAASSSDTWYIMPYAKAQGFSKPTPIRTLGGASDYIAIGKTSSNGGDDNPVIPNGEIIFKESFDNVELADGWSQLHELGQGEWVCRLVIKGDDNSRTPPPYQGTGYAHLTYESGTAFANIRTVTRLITPQLYGNADAGYMLSFQCRRFSSKIGTSEILAVYIDRGCTNNWELLTEQAVTNSSQWLSVDLPYEVDGNYRLCIEGSIEYGANLYIDELCIYRDDTLPVSRLDNMETDSYDLFTLSGLHVQKPVHGVHILKRSNGTVSKVYQK